MNIAVRTVATGLLVAAICVGCVLLAIYPYRPASAWSWAILFVVALPVAAGYELLGNKLFSASTGKGLGILWRIGYGVIVLLVVMVASWLLLQAAQRYLTTWGA